MHTKLQPLMKISASLTEKKTSQRNVNQPYKEGQWSIKCSVINIINLDVKLHVEVLYLTVMRVEI